MAFESRDRFGNPQLVIGLKDKKGNGFPRGYFEIKGQLYQITISSSNKEGIEAWATIKKVEKSKGNTF